MCALNSQNNNKKSKATKRNKFVSKWKITLRKETKRNETKRIHIPIAKMSEFRFFSYTDFAFLTNSSQNILNLPIKPYHVTKPVPSALASDDPGTELNIPYTVFEILVAIVSIIGNLMVIIVFRRERKLRRRTNYYIVSLAMADFLVGLLGVPFAVLASIGLPRNLHACLFTVSLLVVLCTISIFCLVAVSVDRYWAILYPMAYSRNVRTRTAIVIISLCWVAGAVVGFLPLFGWHADVDHDQACLFVEVMDYNYLVFLYFATIITPALLMLAFYAHIYRVIVKQVRQIVTMNPATDLSRRSSTAQIQISTPARMGCHGGTMLRVLGAARKRDVKATQNLSIIVLFFMICWIPLYTINCIKAFCPTCYVHPKLTLFCIILSHLNSAVNPVLYAYHLKDFRAALKNLLLRIMGVEIDQQAEAIHRFSLASQHRLQSMDARSMQPRMYIDSPIWLRQQQAALKNSQLLPKCGVVTPCFNNIHQTVAAVASVTTDIERDMWNIVEATSGAELGEINYEFPSDRADSDKDSNLTNNSKEQQQQRNAHKRRYDSTYSYDNHNYSSSNEDNNAHNHDEDDNDDDDDDDDYEDVFLSNNKQHGNSHQHAVDPIELRKSLIACVMREKLRSDNVNCRSHQRALSDSCHADFVELPNQCSANTSPTHGKSLLRMALQREATSNSCLPAAAAAAAATAAVYVIDSNRPALRSPGHKPKYRRPTYTKHSHSRKMNRSCSCTSNSTPSPAKEVAGPPISSHSLCSTPGADRAERAPELENCANSHKLRQNVFSNNLNFKAFHTLSNSPKLQFTEQQQQSHQQQQQHQQHQQQSRLFSPLKTVGNFMFHPISKHSSLFHIFQASSTTTAATHSKSNIIITTATTTTTTPIITTSAADLSTLTNSTSTNTNTRHTCAANVKPKQHFEYHNNIMPMDKPNSIMRITTATATTTATTIAAATASMPIIATTMAAVTSNSVIATTATTTITTPTMTTLTTSTTTTTMATTPSLVIENIKSTSTSASTTIADS